MSVYSYTPYPMMMAKLEEVTGASITSVTGGAGVIIVDTPDPLSEDALTSLNDYFAGRYYTLESVT